MSNTKKKRLRVSLAVLRSTDTSVVARGQAVVAGMTGNPDYSNPPIDPAALKAALEVFSIAIVNAMDGGRKAIIARRDAREAVIRMLRALAHYVESACNDNMKTFLSSGFEPLIIVKSAPQPLSGTSIRRIAYGVSGQLLVRVNSVPQAWSYELRYAPLGPQARLGRGVCRPLPLSGISSLVTL